MFCHISMSKPALTANSYIGTLAYNPYHRLLQKVHAGPGACRVSPPLLHTGNQAVILLAYPCFLQVLFRKGDCPSTQNWRRIISLFYHIRIHGRHLIHLLAEMFSSSSVAITCILSCGKRRTDAPILIRFLPRRMETTWMPYFFPKFSSANVLPTHADSPGISKSVRCRSRDSRRPAYPVSSLPYTRHACRGTADSGRMSSIMMDCFFNWRESIIKSPATPPPKYQSDGHLEQTGYNEHDKRNAQQQTQYNGSHQRRPVSTVILP